MSTRCHLKVTDHNQPVAKIYRHCDGYPTGMGEDIIRLLKNSKNPNPTSFVTNMLALAGLRGSIELVPINGGVGGTDYEYTVDFSYNKDPYVDAEYAIKVSIMKVNYDESSELLTFGTPEEVLEWIRRKDK